MTNEGFDAAEISDEELHAARLAASRALLDPDRRSARQDIIVSTIIEILSRGPQTPAHLQRAVERVWGTKCITNPVFDRAVRAAEAAALIATREQLTGTVTWELTRATQLEVDNNRADVEAVLLGFAREVKDRLFDYGEPGLVARAERIANEVVAAVVCAAPGVRHADVAGTAGHIPVIDANSVALQDRVSRLEPKSIRGPVADLARDALNRADPFGNEIVHLAVVGGLLRDVVANRDELVPKMDNGRLLLDTSVLIELVPSTEPGGQQSMRDLISCSTTVGYAVLVADHTVDEWDRLWADADRELVGLSSEQRALLAFGGHIVGNPFAATYADYLMGGGDEGWPAWSARYRSLADLLHELPAQTRPHGNVDEWASLAEDTTKRLRELSNDPEYWGHRTRRAALADGNTAAMIARWRSRTGPSSAYFIARERMTGDAYGALTGDAESLTVDPASWLFYVANASTDDQNTAVGMAELIADAALRNTIYSVANGHSVEDVVRIVETLSVDGWTPTVQELSEAADPTLLDVIAATEDVQEWSPDLAGAQALRNRSARLSRRAKAKEDRLDGEIASRDMALMQTKDALLAATGESEELRSHGSDLVADRDRERAGREEAESREARLSRLLLAGGSGLVVAAAVLVAVTTGALGVVGAAVALLLLGWLGFAAWDWVDDPAGRPLWRALLKPVTAEVIAIAIGQLW